MAQEKGELRLFIDEFKALVREMGKDMANKLGTIKEPVSAEEQMQAYLALTVEDKGALLRQWGDTAVDKYVATMEKRLRQSEAAQERMRKEA